MIFKKLKYFLFSSLICLILIGAESPLFASYEIPNFDNLDKDLSELWVNDPAGQTIFLNRVSERLPDYKVSFEQASKDLDVHWTLIAAISYQESHWDPKAISQTGVRGMMMLTQQTAKSLGITNRIDPRNSIIGGSRHLADISAAINYGLTDSDRINFALATYNLGATNINNAIAQIDIEPQLLTWNDLKKELLVLDGDELYFKPQNGYSRGQQTIDFVERTREYALLMRVFSCKDSINQLTAASGT